MKWELGVSRCKLSYRKWIDNKSLLCSPGNYIQYPMINCNGKGNEQDCMHTYDPTSLLCSRN